MRSYLKVDVRVSEDESAAPAINTLESWAGSLDRTEYSFVKSPCRALDFHVGGKPALA